MPQYINIIQAISQEFFLITENFVFLLLIPVQKLGTLITRHKVRPTVLGFGVRAHIIQILGCVEEIGVMPFLA